MRRLYFPDGTYADIDASSQFLYKSHNGFTGSKKLEYSCEKILAYQTNGMQGMDIHDGVIYQAVANSETQDLIKKFSLSSGGNVVEISAASGHGNAMQFSDEYYSDDDALPLLYVSTGSKTDCVVNVFRIVDSNATLIKSYSIPAECGYYAQGVLDESNNVLVCIGLKEANYQTYTATNRIIISVLDVLNVTDQTPAIIKKFEIPWLKYTQGIKCFGGYLWMINSEPSNMDTTIRIIDYMSGDVVLVLDDFPQTVKNNEVEDIAFVSDGKKYYAVLAVQWDGYYKVEFNR